MAKSGAIVSSAGVALLVTFVVILLVFPVIKECEGNAKCSYTSTGPEYFKAIVQPGFLAVSLIIISVGIFMVRFGRWKSQNNIKGSS